MRIVNKNHRASVLGLAKFTVAAISLLPYFAG